VVLHHPPYTASTSYSEQPELQGVRDNLLPLVRDHVHLVLGGHAHAFEWLRSDAAPHVAFIQSGGGGQLTLARSILDPRRIEREAPRVRALREAGVTECLMAGRGPAAPDGEAGALHHYLRIVVGPQRLLVQPVGIRRLVHRYRREQPIPVHWTAALDPSRPSFQVRRLDAIEIRRGEPPRPVWAETA
jgi:hypothetical protein